MPPPLQATLSSIVNIPLWYSLGKYLGVHAEWGNSRGQALHWIKERVVPKLDDWKEQFPYQAGKEVLIKTIIQAIPSYVMAIVRLPKNFRQSLYSAISNFWWSSKVNNRGIHWKCWDYMCLPKNKG